MIAYPIILWKYFNSKGNKKYQILSVLGLNFFIHVLSGSRTSLITSVVGILIWLFMQRSWVKLIAMGSMVIIGGFLLSQLSLASFQRDGGSSILELSERDIIWDGAIILAKEKPLLGYGYAVESKIFANQTKYDTEGTFLNLNAQQPLHNGFLSIFVGGGSIGLLLWLIAIFIPIFFALNSNFSFYKLYTITTMIPILISNIVESAITGYLGATDIFFWLAWIVAGKLYVLEKNKAPNHERLEDSKTILRTKEIVPNV